MDLGEFCKRIGGVNSLGAAQTAVCLLWWHTRKQGIKRMTSSALARVMRDHGLGNPNTTWLTTAIQKLKLTLKRPDGLQLKSNADAIVSSWLQEALDGVAVEVPREVEFLPSAVWVRTRGYIENVCNQLNGCYHYGFHDAASVLLRRLIETLIIEAYEHLHREKEIKDTDGNYFMLSALVDAAVGVDGLSLGRETKTMLREIKKSGDRSAHNRRYNANKADLDRVRAGVRVATEELINVAGLQRRG